MSQAEWENLASLLSLGAALVVTVVLLLGLVSERAIVWTESGFNRLADMPPLCALLLSVCSLILCFLVAVHKGIPQPLIHDEFSYLLAADTFAHGRLTNPTPACWESFETPQQLMRPTYMSKYPPGQGMALALGQVLTGWPIAGVWLSTAAGVVAIYWMLLGFVPRRWALLGGMVSLLHPQILDWSQCYWGGAVAMTGGAVLIGAWGRLMIASTRNAAVLLAVGLIILANSRPFEGVVLAVPLMIPLAIRFRRLGKHLLIFTIVPLFLSAVAMSYYNYRITGHFWRIPYLEYASQYEIYPKFWFLPPGSTPVYRNAAMEFVHRYFEKGAYEGFHTLRGAIDNSQYRFNLLFTAMLALSVLLLPWIVAVFDKGDKRLTWVKVSVGVTIIAMWTEIFVFPHYLAPALPMVLLMVIMGWRQLSGWKCGGRPDQRGRPFGKTLARAAAIGFLVGAGMAAAQPSSHDSLMLDQQSVIDQFPVLKTGRHLIFVSYAPLRSAHAELVHNLSNLQQSRIIWARSLGPSDDHRAAQYYKGEHDKGREVWLLHVGGKLELTHFVIAVSPDIPSSVSRGRGASESNVVYLQLWTRLAPETC